MDDYKNVLMLVSYLLEYPDEEWWKNFSTYRTAVEEVAAPQEKQVLEEFFDYVADMTPAEYEELYVRTFEFSQNTNLYLSTHNRTDFGKQAEELHEYKVLFLDNGFDVDEELPDYLPALLELAAAAEPAESRQVLAAIKPKVELLRDRFIEAKLAYAFLMDVILTQAARLEEAV